MNFKEIPQEKNMALLLYLSLQALHLFKDGNGRTGRVIYSTITNENITKDYLKELVEHNGEKSLSREKFAENIKSPEKIYPLINRELFKDIFGQDFQNIYGRITAQLQLGFVEVPNNENISKNTKKELLKILADGGVRNFSFRDITLLQFIQKHNLLEKYQYQIDRKLTIEECTNSDDYNKSILSFDGEKLLDDLNQTDAVEIISISRDVKKEFVEKMIDIISNSEKYSTNQEKTLKEEFVNA